MSKQRKKHRNLAIEQKFWRYLAEQWSTIHGLAGELGKPDWL